MTARDRRVPGQRVADRAARADDQVEDARRAARPRRRPRPAGPAVSGVELAGLSTTVLP